MIGTAHFHCEHCDGPLVFGKTRAVCGAVIPPQEETRFGLNRRCRRCKGRVCEHAHETPAVS